MIVYYIYSKYMSKKVKPISCCSLFSGLAFISADQLYLLFPGMQIKIICLGKAFTNDPISYTVMIIIVLLPHLK